MTEATKEELQEWISLGTPAISDSNGRQAVMASRIRPRTGEALVGRAYCVRVVVGDSGSLHQALAQAPAGSVLVIDGGGYTDRAVWGEVLTAVAQERGVIGAVIDGAIRDVSAIRRRGFTVFSAAISAAGPHKAAGGNWGGSVSCGGVTVATGDLVVGDEDGVVVVPWGERQAVLHHARGTIEKEASLMAKIANGLSTAEYFGLADPSRTTPSERRDA